MVNVLFRQSEVEDPYAFYAQMVSKHPICFDSANKIWAVYSYTTCQRLLNAEFAYIPDPNQAVKAQLSASARLIAEHVIRLQNPPRHGITRSIVLRLVEHMRPMETSTLLDAILAGQERSFDWVAVVARRLPTQALLAGFGFAPETAERLLSLLDSLVKITLPGKSGETFHIVNAAADEAYPLVERHITGTHDLWSIVENESKREEVLQVITANLIGLLIQGYDAGRGILSNTLLQYIRQAKTGSHNNNLVVETLRYDPPVHNTRRILAQALVVDDLEIKEGEPVLLVLAAANRDPLRFANPARFDPMRPNNSEHLTFGAGVHECLAGHFIVKLAVETLDYLSTCRPDLHILTKRIEYEPLINVRLPQTIQIAF